MIALTQELSTTQTLVDSLGMVISRQDSLISLLNFQIEAAGHYEGQILGIVHWSLGILVTIAVALVGFGWFVNFRLYDRDKSAMLHLLSEEIGERAITIQEDIEAMSHTAHSRLEGNLSTFADSKIWDVQRRVQILEYSSAVAEAWRWVRETDPEKHLEAGIRATNIAIKLETYGQFHVFDALGIVAEALAAGADVDGKAASDANAMLSALPDLYEDEADHIRESVTRARRRAR